MTAGESDAKAVGAAHLYFEGRRKASHLLLAFDPPALGDTCSAARVSCALLASAYPMGGAGGRGELLHLESLDSTGALEKGYLRPLAHSLLSHLLSCAAPLGVYTYARPRPWILFRNSHLLANKRVREKRGLEALWRGLLEAQGYAVALVGSREVQSEEWRGLIGGTHLRSDKGLPVHLEMSDEPVGRAYRNIVAVQSATDCESAGCGGATELVLGVLMNSRDLSEGTLVFGSRLRGRAGQSNGPHSIAPARISRRRFVSICRELEALDFGCEDALAKSSETLLSLLRPESPRLSELLIRRSRAAGSAGSKDVVRLGRLGPSKKPSGAR